MSVRENRDKHEDLIGRLDPVWQSALLLIAPCPLRRQARRLSACRRPPSGLLPPKHFTTDEGRKPGDGREQHERP